MKYVIAGWDDETRSFWMDPRPYLEVLPELGEALPVGARAFARAAGHYDFSSDQCVKDLQLSVLESSGDGSARITFKPNPWKHPSGLILEYVGVTSVVFEKADEASSDARNGSVLLDEVLPLAGTVVHEIVMTDSTLRVTAKDLEGRWGDDSDPSS